jgi:hypothetical protein
MKRASCTSAPLRCRRRSSNRSGALPPASPFAGAVWQMPHGASRGRAIASRAALQPACRARLLELALGADVVVRALDHSFLVGAVVAVRRAFIEPRPRPLLACCPSMAARLASSTVRCCAAFSSRNCCSAAARWAPRRNARWTPAGPASCPLTPARVGASGSCFSFVSAVRHVGAHHASAAHAHELPLRRPMRSSPAAPRPAAAGQAWS